MKNLNDVFVSSTNNHIFIRLKNQRISHYTMIFIKNSLKTDYKLEPGSKECVHSRRSPEYKLRKCKLFQVKLTLSAIVKPLILKILSHVVKDRNGVMLRKNTVEVFIY